MGNVKKVDTRPRHKTDWPSIRMLYATGTTFPALAESTGIPLGTITARSSREGWDTDRKRLKELADQARLKSQELLATMPERAKNWVSRVAEQADRGLRVIEKEPIESLKDVTRVTSALDQVDKVARRSYGLDQDGAVNRTIVNLGFLSDYAPESLGEKPLTIENPPELLQSE